MPRAAGRGVRRDLVHVCLTLIICIGELLVTLRQRDAEGTFFVGKRAATDERRRGNTQIYSWERKREQVSGVPRSKNEM